MDKYDYKLKTEQMLELMEDGSYGKAAAIADEIDWKRVRNVTMLTNVSDIYEKNKEFQKSYDVLRTAYHRADGSRKVIFKLCTLAIKTGNVDEAIDYYDDFMQTAPKDPNQHILRYQILRAQRAPIEQQIEALEEFKKAEYIEEWAYELAKLYQEAGMTAECLEECDDLILWFSEGQYVYKAMELKMQYKPLTPSQQEKYDHRFEKVTAETEEMPDLESFYGNGDEEETKTSEEREVDRGISDSVDALEQKETDYIEGGQSEEAEEMNIPEPRTGGKTGKIGDTMRLDEALQKLLHPGEESALSGENASIIEGESEPDMTDLASEIDEIESVADLDMVHQVSENRERNRNELREPMAASSGFTELIPEESEELEEEILSETLDVSEAEEFLVEGENEGEVAAEPRKTDDDQITGQMSLADILSGWETQDEELAEERTESEDIPEEIIEEPESEEVPEEIIEELESEEVPEEIIEEPESEDIPEEIIEEPESEDIPKEIIEEPESEEISEEIIEEAEIEETEENEAETVDEDGERLQKQNEEDIIRDTITETEEGEKTGEIMEEKRKTEPILPPDIQRMIDEIEGVIPPEEPVKEKGRVEDSRENMGKLADELRIDDDLALDDPDDYEDYEESEDFFEEEDLDPDGGEEYEDEYSEAEEFEDEEYEEEYSEAEEYEEGDSQEDYEEDEEEYPEEDEYFSEDDAESLTDDEEIIADDGEDYFSEGDAEEYDDVVPDFEEEFRVNPDHSQEADDREIPDDDDDNLDILSATTPLSRKETAKMIATGKTAPLPLDEISDALSISDTGFIVHGRYDLQMQSGVGTRAGLTEEQKKLFSYFVPVRGMSEQLVDVLEQDKNCTNRNGTSRTGNLLIIGNKGNGKTVLAVDVVKAIQKQRNIRQGKVAIVTGESLNKKKIGDIFNKLYGGALIIEKAGKLNEKTVARLNKAMEKDTGELLIVLEEQRKPLDRLLSSNREFRRKFTSRLEVPIFINDELVTFGQTYAQENGYRIDEMGILALYSRIDSLQREDHAVTVAEVKEVMDEAIQHSQKASAKKLVKRVFGKNTDDADRILLSEKDFNI